VDKVVVLQVDSKWEIHPSTPLTWPKKAPKGRQVLYVPILTYWRENKVVVRKEMKNIVQDRTTMAELLLHSLGKSLSNLVPLEAEVQASDQLKLLADCLNILKRAAFFQESPHEGVDFSFLTGEVNRQTSMPNTMFEELKEEFQKQKTKNSSFKGDFKHVAWGHGRGDSFYHKPQGRGVGFGRGNGFGGRFARGNGFGRGSAFRGRGNVWGQGNTSSAMSVDRQ